MFDEDEKLQQRENEVNIILIGDTHKEIKEKEIYNNNNNNKVKYGKENIEKK